MSDQKAGENATEASNQPSRSKLAARLQAFQQPSSAASSGGSALRPLTVSGGSGSLKDRIAKFQEKAEGSTPPVPSSALGLGGPPTRDVSGGGSGSGSSGSGLIGNRIPTGDKSAAYVGVGGHAGRRVSENKGLIGTRLASFGKGRETGSSGSSSPVADGSVPMPKLVSSRDASPASASGLSARDQRIVSDGTTEPTYLPADIREEDLVPSTLPDLKPLETPGTPLSTAAEPSESSPSIAPSTPRESDIPLIRVPSNLSSATPSVVTDASEPISAATSITGVPSSMMVETEGEGPTDALDDVDGVSTPSSTPKVVRRELPLVEEGVPPLTAMERDALEQEAIGNTNDDDVVMDSVGDDQGLSTETEDSPQSLLFEESANARSVDLVDKGAAMELDETTQSSDGASEPLGSSAKTPRAERSAFLNEGALEAMDISERHSSDPDIEEADDVDVLRYVQGPGSAAAIDNAPLPDGTSHIEIGKDSPMEGEPTANDVKSNESVEANQELAIERLYQAPSGIHEPGPSSAVDESEQKFLSEAASPSSRLPLDLSQGETIMSGRRKSDITTTQEEDGLMVEDYPLSATAADLAGGQYDVEPQPFVVPRREVEMEGIAAGPTTLSGLRSLIGQSLSSAELRRAIDSWVGSVNDGSTSSEPEIKAFSDSVYLNYYPAGFSLCFVPRSGKNLPKKWSPGEVVLDGIDIYNPDASSTPAVAKSGSASRKKDFAACSFLPLELSQQNFLDPTETTGRTLVSTLGEPSKKGGGEGLWLDVYLEWENLGLSVDLREPVNGKERMAMTEGEKAKGMGGVWDRAGRWGWKCAKVFKPAGDGAAELEKPSSDRDAQALLGDLPSVPQTEIPIGSTAPGTPTEVQTPLSASFLNTFPAVPDNEVDNKNEKVNVQVALSPHRPGATSNDHAAAKQEAPASPPRTSLDSLRVGKAAYSSPADTAGRRTSAYGPRDPLEEVDAEGEGGWAAVSSERVRYA